MELAGADARGRYVSSATFESPTPQIGLAESQPFRFDLQTTGTEVRFDLFYDYGFLQEPVSWPLAAAGNVPFHLAQGFKSIVRDACSPTQHLTH